MDIGKQMLELTKILLSDVPILQDFALVYVALSLYSIQFKTQVFGIEDHPLIVMDCALSNDSWRI